MPDCHSTEAHRRAFDAGRRPGRPLPVLGLMAVALVMTTTLPAADKPKRGITIDVPTLVGFKAPINEGNRTVGLVSGSEAKPSLLSGQVEVKDFRLETYRYNPDRETELIAESPLAVFGPAGASSDRRISLRSADGRFAIGGEGWTWTKTGGLLVISNSVQATLRRPGAATNRPPIEMSSRRFEYHMETGDARFVENCEAIEPAQARLKAGELAARLSVRTEKPDAIRATNGVVIELLRKGHQGRASGAAATYLASPEGEQIEITGSPKWELAVGEGSADLLRLRPAKDAYEARGNARLRLRRPAPPPARESAPAPSPSPAPAPVKDPSAPVSIPLEIACDLIEGNPAEVVFSGRVVATQGSKLEVHAERIVAELEPAPESREPTPRQVTATGHVEARVRAGRESVEIRGESMRYALGESSEIHVDGQPTWRSSTHSGSSDRFVIYPDAMSFEAIDHVRATWSPMSGTTNAQPIALQAARMAGGTNAVRFDGGVRASRETWDLDAMELDLLLSTNSVPRELVARGNVRLEYRMPLESGRTNDRSAVLLGAPETAMTEAARTWRIEADEVRAGLAGTNSSPSSIDATGAVRISNPGVHARGTQLRYRAEDGFLRLSGDAELHAASGIDIVGEPNTALALDPRTGRFLVDGRWRRMSMPAAVIRGHSPTNRPGQR